MTFINRAKFDPIILTITGISFPIFSVVWLYFNFSWSVLFLTFLISWLLGICTTMFAHRAWSHKAWTPKKWLNIMGLSFFTISFSGNSIGWVSVHREHHRYSDTEKDPHSPYFIPRWRVHFLSYYNKIKIPYVADLLRAREHLWFAKNYWFINFGLLVILYLIDPWLLGFWISTLGNYVIKMHMVNSLGHDTPKFLLPVDKQFGASNSLGLMIILGCNGEAMHKNHHEDPKNWKFSKRWYEIDLASGFILGLSKIGAASLSK